MSKLAVVTVVLLCFAVATSGFKSLLEHSTRENCDPTQCVSLSYKCIPPLTDVQVGVCKGARKTCKEGNWVNQYNMQHYGEESCDGRDNDCDGITDEDQADAPTTCGSGACANTGVVSCINGQWIDNCQPLETCLVLSNVMTDLSELVATVTAQGNDITSLGTTVAGHTSSINGLGNQVTSLGTTVAGHTTTLTGHTTTLTGHSERITELEDAASQLTVRGFYRVVNQNQILVSSAFDITEATLVCREGDRVISYSQEIRVMDAADPMPRQTIELVGLPSLDRDTATFKLTQRKDYGRNIYVPAEAFAIICADLTTGTKKKL